MGKRVLVVEKLQNWDGSSIYYAYEKSDPSIYEVGESIHQAIGFFLYATWQRDGNEVVLSGDEPE